MEFRHSSDIRYHVEDVIRSYPLAKTTQPAPVDEEARADDEEGDGRTIVGYPVVFDGWTEINSWDGPFLERIDPKAANRTLNNNFDQIQFMFNHGFHFALEQTPIGKYRSLTPDSQGVYGVAQALREGTNEMIDTVVELIDMRAIYGQSFRFSVMAEEWVESPDPSDYNPRAIPERTIKEFRWFESGPVTYPAYQATTVSLRDGEPFAVRSTAEFEEWCERRNVDPTKPVTWKRPTSARAASILIRSRSLSRAS